MQGLIIAGASSNCGKTTTALGLICALRMVQIPVLAAKAGPDFIDAGWLAKAADTPAPNFDLWMCGQNSSLASVLKYFSPIEKGFLVVEGAMGLYDGDAKGRASTAELAAKLSLPVLLLLNARGMGQSIAPLAHGFLDWKNRLPAARHMEFMGIICTHVGGSRHKTILKEALAPVCEQFSTPLLGCLPGSGAPQIPSRHLGLIQAHEQELDIAAIGQWFTEHCDLQAFFQLAPMQPAPSIVQDDYEPDTVRVAIAKDEAFSFYYADLPLLLQNLGAKITFFSPLYDRAAPDCDAIYFPGGYPELYAQKLSENTAFRKDLTNLAATGIPIYGECGGYMYLMEKLQDNDGAVWPMCGLLPGKACMTTKIAALGYRKAESSWLIDKPVYGHEFHYARQTAQGIWPLWQINDSLGTPLPASGAINGNIAGSWLHLYPAGSSHFWRAWLNLAKENAIRNGTRSGQQTG